MVTSGQSSEPKQLVMVRFRQPIVRPGTPEAARHGCVGNFERNLQAELMSDPQGDDVIVVSHEACPLHEVIRGPTDPEFE